MYKFYDLDGVLIDSAYECFEISSKVFYKNQIPQDCQKLFIKFRGLVLDAKEYLVLHKSIDLFLKGQILDIEKQFNLMLNLVEKYEYSQFQKEFFDLRGAYQDSDFTNWIKLNPLTKFGRYVQKEKSNNVIIITSKNFVSAERILDFYNISYEDLIGAEKIISYGNKGKVIDKLVKDNRIQNSIFIDDSVRNLDSVKNKNVKCFFANWGYGKNSYYPVFKF